MQRMEVKIVLYLWVTVVAALGALLFLAHYGVRP